MAELFVELLSEEIPARMQIRAAEDLKRLVGDGLKAAGLEFTKTEAFATPRRLALVVEGLPVSQPDLRDEKRGPRVGSPDKAIEGFLKSAGLSSIDQAEKRVTDKGEFYFAVFDKKGQPTANVIYSLLRDVINTFPWPKSMRWGSLQRFRWVRPLQSIICMLDGKVIDLHFGKIEGILLVGHRIGDEYPGVPTSNTTVGHRFHAPQSFTVTSFADYCGKLREAHVILDAEERKAIIKNKAASLAKAEGLTVRDDIGLLDEVAGLVEWPVPYVGKIDEAFMEVPQEVLVTSMRAHQKYFACLKSDGSLASRFIVIANTETQDAGKVVVAGNERVLRARLSDAKFFWDQDRKIKLIDRVSKLSAVVFHAKLGDMLQRTIRIERLADFIRIDTSFSNVDRDTLLLAARLTKADLVSDMVGEFPELQGTMGRYYALEENLPVEVADAIAQHYLPLGPSDRCPENELSQIVALADKIDLLTGFWAIDELPTGSRDPFALRRAALGIIRIILEGKKDVGLLGLFTRAYLLYFAGLNSQKLNRFTGYFDEDVRDFAIEKELDQFVKASILGSFLSENYDYEKAAEVLKKHSETSMTFLRAFPAIRKLSEGLRTIEEFVAVRHPEKRYLNFELYEWEEHLSTREEKEKRKALAEVRAIALQRAEKIFSFLAERLRGMLRDQGMRHDVISAIIDLKDEDSLIRVSQRISNLKDFIERPSGNDVLQAYRRINNIIRAADFEESALKQNEIDAGLFELPAEQQFYAMTIRLQEKIEEQEASYRRGEIPNLYPAVSAVKNFFDDVMVNAADPAIRQNRLNLLFLFKSTMDRVADFSKIEG